MLLVVGLGNPGPEYASTRHNVGFMVVDRLARDLSLSWRQAPYPGLEARGGVDGRRLVLLKPMTFMNLSGGAVAAAARRHGAGPAEICVVYDDLDLPPGALRIRGGGGGAGGHRGVLSIIEALGSRDFLRVRVGIGRPLPGRDAARHVLSPFPEREWEAVAPAVERAAEAVLAVLREGPERAMNRFNG